MKTPPYSQSFCPLLATVPVSLYLALCREVVLLESFQGIKSVVFRRFEGTTQLVKADVMKGNFKRIFEIIN